ncbi:transmembrane protein with metallophosphoesterase domain [Protopterus annectens]|uniref:transmembrane protein with metallophosphoesterase domain n=1 Tax=Protopterus annectens TaxID=7888 RepID=UPI001CFB96A0|nr:transmembrane protein with metallophosphoesterase domain [Protopterus annectens]
MSAFKKLSLELKVALAAAAVLFSMVVSRTYLIDNIESVTRMRLFRVQFLVLVNVLMLIGSLYIWKRTVVFKSSQAAQSCCLSVWKLCVLLFLTLAHCSFFTLILLVGEEPYLFAQVAYTCLGAYVILLFWLFVLGCLEQCHRLLLRGRVTKTAMLNGRNVSKVTLAVAVTVVLTVIGLLNGSRPPAITRVEIPVHRLPKSFDNMKMVLISDIHLGPTVGKTKLEVIVKMVNNLKPDVIVIVGDLVDSQVVNLKSAVEPLKDLKSNLGTYFVTGNHEYYTVDVDNWFKHLQSLNIHPLHNENAKIFSTTSINDWICLAGVDDIEAAVLRYPGHGMNLEKALNGCSQSDVIVLLAHQPRAAKWALETRPDISLVLSGHTHGGQMFPLTIGAYLMNPFFAGLYKVGESSYVYVTTGTIYYGIPMRLASRSEIVEIILQSH